MPRTSRLSKPLPWYEWCPLQWQASRKVQRMTFAERGLYRELMDECWLKGSVPGTVAGIADLFDMEETEIEPHFSAVRRCFDEVEGGRLVSPFIEELRTAADEYRVRQREAKLRRKLDQQGGTSTSEVVHVPAWTSSTVQNSTEQEKDSSSCGPKKPRKEKAPKERKDLGGDLGLLEELHGLYPARPGKAKGNRAKTLPRVQAVMVLHGLSREDCMAVVKAYQQHPNVLEGFVQLTETFWGESGHWLDCWTVVAKQRSAAAQENGAGPSGGGNGVSSTVAAPVGGAGALNGEIRSQEVVA